MIRDTIQYEGLEIKLAPPIKLNKRPLTGRCHELEIIRAAWNITEGDTDWHIMPQSVPMNIRLTGPPGYGKNTLIEYVAGRLPLYNFFSLTGHESLEPEDLILSIVPGTEEKGKFYLQASPLLTALLSPYSICFFDELTRIPERSLSVLASLLDHRRSLYSGLVNKWFEPVSKDPSAFLFCAAMNRQHHMNLPEYIEQRMFPCIDILKPSLEEIIEIVRLSVNPSKTLLNHFIKYYMDTEDKKTLSPRQCISMVDLAMRHKNFSSFQKLEPYLISLN